MKLCLDGFYVPLPSLRVDVYRLIKEIDHILVPGNAYGLTVAPRCKGLPYGFNVFNGTSLPDADGTWRLDSGDADHELIHWPAELEISYVREIAEMLGNYLGMPPPRARASRIDASGNRQGIDMHADPHTPFRIHIALETSLDATWRFRSNGRHVRIHQPADGIPVYVETATTYHAVDVLSGRRTHLWYQWYQPLSTQARSRIGSHPAYMGHDLPW